MKTNSRISLFGLLALMAIGVSTCLLVRAEENPHYGSDANRHDRYLSHGRGGFALGVCVGQALAAQGITLPTPIQGAPYLNPQNDTTAQAAIEAAVTSCRAEFSGTSPSSTPSQAPSASPTEIPSPAPSTNGT